jgi:hypothetical protein
VEEEEGAQGGTRGWEEDVKRTNTGWRLGFLVRFLFPMSFPSFSFSPSAEPTKRRYVAQSVKIKRGQRPARARLVAYRG